MDFKVFDITRMEEYARKAKEQWGQMSSIRNVTENANNRLTTRMVGETSCLYL